MIEEDYPSLYRSANDASMSAQKVFLNSLKYQLIFLVVASIFSFLNIPNRLIAAIQFIFLLAALGCSIYMVSQRPVRLWYAGRAVAESIKTITWRYVTRAEPFDGDDEFSKNEFAKKLKLIVNQNSEICQKFTNYLGGDQITAAMDKIRSKNLIERKNIYLEDRIIEQMSWYAKKAKYNKTMANIFFSILIAVNFLAVLFSLLKIIYVDDSLWPIDVFVSVAAGVLSWMQAKRFSELSASYALAAHEISLIKESALISKNENDFSRFVGDAENAFSREHTQWVARQDVA